MTRIKAKKEQRTRRHRRVRAKVCGTAECPRLSVFRSNRHIWAQLIDDSAGATICSSGDLGLKQKVKSVEIAMKVGVHIAECAKENKINSAVFDRGGYQYHGIVKAVAEGARKGGLKL